MTKEMENEYGGDFISITDEEGNEFELELLDVLVHNDTYYHAFIPASESEDEDEEVELVILKAVEQDGEELLSTLDDEEELNEVYDLFMDRLFEEEEEETEEEIAED
ncbi:MAG: DUF1292 domain-containing protein [Oscillospiraceae bacterium]|nr:DUF1292 domain-containing protein [Oscillospiraceae bacterium]